jgi:hypothetical protein
LHKNTQNLLHNRINFCIFWNENLYFLERKFVWICDVIFFVQFSTNFQLFFLLCTPIFDFLTLEGSLARTRYAINVNFLPKFQKFNNLSKTGSLNVIFQREPKKFCLDSRKHVKFGLFLTIFSTKTNHTWLTAPLMRHKCPKCTILVPGPSNDGKSEITNYVEFSGEIGRPGNVCWKAG